MAILTAKDLSFAYDGKTVLELGERVGPREDPYLPIYELFDKKYEFGN